MGHELNEQYFDDIDLSKFVPRYKWCIISYKNWCTITSKITFVKVHVTP